MKISELANKANVSVETIRYYQREQLLDIPSNQTGIRQYALSHLEKMQFIKNAKLAGFSIAEIKQLIQFDSVKDRTTILALSEHKKKDLQIKIQELKSAMTFLQSLVTQCKSSEQPECPILEGLKGDC